MFWLFYQINYVSAHDNETLFDIVSLKVYFNIFLQCFILSLSCKTPMFYNNSILKTALTESLVFRLQWEFLLMRDAD